MAYFTMLTLQWSRSEIIIVRTRCIWVQKSGSVTTITKMVAVLSTVAQTVAVLSATIFEVVVVYD